MKHTSGARGLPPLVSILAAAALLSAAALAAPASAQQPSFEEMCQALHAEAAAFEGRVAFVVQDLTDGSRCERNRDEVYITASLYKVIVLAEAHRQREAGTFSFDERIIGLRADVAIESMIQMSTNATAHALLERLGYDNVEALPGQLGMGATIIRGEDYATTAADIAHFFAQLQARSLISPEADAAMLELLLGQQVSDRIPVLLPPDLPIAHKTGRLDRFAHDAGIVYAPGGAYVLVVLTEGAPYQNWLPGHDAIRRLAAISYTAYAELPSPTPTSATPEATPTATPTATAEPTATPSPAPTPTAAATEAATAARTSGATPTATPSPTTTPTAAPQPTATSEPTPAATPSPTASPAAALAAAGRDDSAEPASATRERSSTSFGPPPAGLLLLAVVLSFVSLGLLAPGWRRWRRQ